ncbi:splicing factor 3b subunit 2 [Rhodnius prolixus]
MEVDTNMQHNNEAPDITSSVATTELSSEFYGAAVNNEKVDYGDGPPGVSTMPPPPGMGTLTLPPGIPSLMSQQLQPAGPAANATLPAASAPVSQLNPSLTPPGMNPPQPPSGMPLGTPPVPPGMKPPPPPGTTVSPQQINPPGMNISPGPPGIASAPPPPGMTPPGMAAPPPPPPGPPGMAPPPPPGMAAPPPGPPGMAPPPPPGMTPPGMPPNYQPTLQHPSMAPHHMQYQASAPQPPTSQPLPMMHMPPTSQPPPLMPSPNSQPMPMAHQMASLMPPPNSQPPPNFDQMQERPPGEEEQTPQQSQTIPSLMDMHVQPPPGLKIGKEQERERDRDREHDQKLPQALEKALAFKTQRANELGVPVEAEETREPDPPADPPTPVILQSAFDDIEDYEDEDDKVGKKITKRDEKKKLKNKRKKKRNKSSKIKLQEENVKNKEEKDDETKTKEETEVEVEYIQEKLNLFELEPHYRGFGRIFDMFKIVEPAVVPDISKEIAASAALGAKRTDLIKVPKLPEEDDLEEGIGEKGDEKPKLSKRKLKKLTRLSIAELKQLVSRPDVVEMHDVTARDPKLLVQLKAHRNTVPVPRHWCFKRKYLQGKRGIEKPPFDLPDFIKKTGIMEMRSSLQDKEEQRTLKAKMRERARPKMGKIDIDYQKLHDAFFKWQTKPRLTIHGDLYYEGKEYETRLKEKKPGDLSAELRTALGMPVGPSAHKVPPPWLIAMQRYGPPPSYPNLKIPGLNCPIPDGCSFGYHAGGWGKPPVDETGKPLYGDVFATNINANDLKLEDDEVEKNVWGELESDSEEESEEEEEEDEIQKDETGLVTPSEGLITPSGIASIPTGMETPDIIELRKKKIEAEMEGGDTPALYQVLAEKRVDRVGTAMMASTHVYDMTSAQGIAAAAAAAVGTGTAPAPRRDTVELALDPSELDLDTDAMAARYEQQMREQQSHLQKEDLSDMLAEHVQRQKNKRKKQQQQEGKPTKKYKEFKF